MHASRAGMFSSRNVKAIPIHARQRILSTKWDFTLKHNKDGNIRKFKASWLVRGFDQRVGLLDYDKECLLHTLKWLASPRSCEP
jgi:hypothetical protein